MHTSSQDSPPQGPASSEPSPAPSMPDAATLEDARADDADPRTREIAANLLEVRARIAEAAEAAGRAECPELIVITKTFPAEDVLRLHRLGVRLVGENKDQEALAKAAAVQDALREQLGVAAEEDLAEQDRMRWHFVGQLQSNKARSAAEYAEAVHSVDRGSLLKALRRAAADRARPLDCLIQVDLRREIPADSRGGAAPSEVPELAARIADSEGLRLAGLMAVAPLEEDPREPFGRLAELAARLRAEHPGAGMISAGMSADLEAATAAGATHLRIGRDVLGKREHAR